MKYSLDNCCGGPKVKRVGEQVRPLTGIEKRNSEDVFEDIDAEFKQAFSTNPREQGD